MTDGERIDILYEEVAQLRETIDRLKGKGQPSIDKLGPKQLAVVRLLQATPGEYRDTEALTDAVYRFDEDVPDYAIAHIVYEIRRNRPDIRQHIKGRRGHGYKWAD